MMLTSIKFHNDVISTNFEVIVIFPIYGQFGSIQKQDSGRMVCKTYIFINSNLLKLKTELKNLQHSSHTIVLSKDTIFVKKC